MHAQILMAIHAFLASFPYAETTKRTYLDVLSRLLTEHEDLANLTATDLLNFLKKSGWGNSRQCVALAASQKYLARKYGQEHPALSAKLKRIVGKPQRALTPELALQLLASFDPYTSKGARDLAICALALDTGLRASELCRLQQADTDTEQRVLQVLIKGGQWAAAVFSSETAIHIEHWKCYRQIADGLGFLFTNTKTKKGLTPEGLYTIVEQWGDNIGVKLSPHDLRRSFAVIGTLNGAPERVLMEAGRWKSTAMVQRYTRTMKLDAMRQYLPVSRLQNPKDKK